MSDTSVSPVVVTRDGPLGYLRLTDSRRRNPLSTSTMKAATAALQDFDADPGVRVVVIGAEGPAFSAAVSYTHLTLPTIYSV